MPVPFARSASQTRPTFSRDFAGLKTLDHGAGPAITFTRASNATFFNASGVLQTASNDQPRFDHSSTGSSLGLLIEEARTNSIRNSQAGGATVGVIGSGGVMPTNWTLGGTLSAHGLTGEVIGTGIEDGLSYADIKVSGTPTGTSTVGINTEQVFQVVASNGQTWTNSAYLRVVGGSTANASVRVYMAGRLAAGTIVAGQTGETTASVTTAALRSQRYSTTLTFSSASVERVSPQVLVYYTSGNPIDLTLRIAAPQLEQGAFPTSYIPTTSAAATRSADSAVVTPISSFYNQSEGTLFAEATLRGITSGSFPRVVQFDEASSSDNRFNILCTSTPAASAEYRTSGVGQLNTTETAITLGTVFRTIAAVATNNGRVSTNGALAGSDDTSLTMNSANTRMRIGTEAGGSFFTGHIRKIAYYPRRLSNALLQQLTT